MKFKTRIKNAYKALTGEYGMEDFDRDARNRYRGGTSNAGVDVNESSAIRFITVYSCVRVLAEAIASLPITLHQERPNGRGSDKVRDHPLYDLLYTAPNTDMTTVTWREQQIASLALSGNCYSVITRNGRGEVIDLYPVPWTDCLPQRDLSDYRIYYQINDRGKSERFPASEVFHVPGMGFDGVMGYSPVRMAAEAIGTGIAAEQFNARFFGQGMNIGSVFQTDAALSDKAFSRLQDDLIERGSGLANSWKPLILEEGLKFNRIPMPLKDAQFIEGRQFTRTEIAGLFRVPPHMIADLSRSTFANIEHQSIDFVTYTLMPYIVAWEKAISWRLLTPEERRRGLYVKFNVSGLLRGDYKSRQEGLAVMRQNGVISTNDWLEIEDMNPRQDEGADAILVNGNMISVAAAAQATANGGVRQVPKIEIKGVIVSNDDAWIYDWFEMDHTSPRSVADEIANANGEPLEIAINSPGGDVYAGSEIYTALKEYQGEVTVKIVGVAASAASVAAMAGDRVLISPTAQIMIHNVSSGAWGDHRDHAHEADILKGWNKSIANAYALKSGLSESELLSMMNKETWLTAQEAKEKGFVDEIMFDEGRRLAASASGLLPPEVIAKLRNELVKTKMASQGQTAARSVSFYAKKLALKEMV